MDNLKLLCMVYNDIMEDIEDDQCSERMGDAAAYLIKEGPEKELLQYRQAFLNTLDWVNEGVSISLTERVGRYLPGTKCTIDRRLYRPGELDSFLVSVDSVDDGYDTFVVLAHEFEVNEEEEA